MIRSHSVVLIFSILASLFTLIGCTNSTEIEYDRGKEAYENKDYKKALYHFDRTIKRGKNKELTGKSALQAADISRSHLNDYQRADRYYRIAISIFENKKKRIESQKKLAVMLYKNVANYQASVIELSKLLNQDLPKKQAAEIRLMLAKSYFYQQNFFQAEVEAKEVLENSSNPETRFLTYDALAAIYQAKGDNDAAVTVLKKTIEEFGEKKDISQMAFNLALNYEEQGKFQKAIDVLQQTIDTHPSPEYVEAKIKRLQDRILNQPGAKGLRK